MITTESVTTQSRYGNGSGLERPSHNNGFLQACDNAPTTPPITSAAQDLLPRIGTLIERGSRISSLLRSVPRPPEGKNVATSNQDLHSTIQLCHGSIDYLEQIVADIERSLGV